MNGLCEQLNPRHSIYQLSKIIDWESLENDFTRLYSRRGRPAKPVRLMIPLLLLKQLHDLSDDQVVEGWIENPSWRYSINSYITFRQMNCKIFGHLYYPRLSCAINL